MEEKTGYIYIYKCIVGSHSDICKIGKTEHYGDSMDRLKQHLRTTYYGFTPYCDFVTGNVIATAFKVKNVDDSDRLAKQLFIKKQISGIEIYNVDYDYAIKKLYKALKKNNQLIELIKDGNSAYDFLNKKVSFEISTTKATFEEIKDQLLSKYGENLPDELLNMLRDRKSFEENCVSHSKSGNYIIFPNDMVLDIHFNKAKRTEILNNLKSFL